MSRLDPVIHVTPQFHKWFKEFCETRGLKMGEYIESLVGKSLMQNTSKTTIEDIERKVDLLISALLEPGAAQIVPKKGISPK